MIEDDKPKKTPSKEGIFSSADDVPLQNIKDCTSRDDEPLAKVVKGRNKEQKSKRKYKKRDQKHKAAKNIKEEDSSDSAESEMLESDDDLELLLLSDEEPKSNDDKSSEEENDSHTITSSKPNDEPNISWTQDCIKNQLFYV